MCDAHQRKVAACYQFIVPQIKTQQALDIFVDSCGPEGLEKLMQGFEEQEMGPEHSAMVNLVLMMKQHPYHKDNQVPGKGIRDDCDDDSF